MKDDKETRLRFENTMNVFAEVFGKPTTRIKNRIYFIALKEYSIDIIEKAAQRIISEKMISTFPLPAEIIEKMNEAKDKIEIEALEAWNEAEKIALLGTRDSENPIVNDTIAMAFGSWEKFGQTEPNNQFDRKHFVECFKLIIKERKTKQLKETKKIKKLKEK